MRSVLLCPAVLLAACGDTAGPSNTGPAPTVHMPNNRQFAVAGQTFSYDATQDGATFSDTDGRFTYHITLGGVAQGLTASGGRVVGTPAADGTVAVAITASDEQQRIARDTFSIVVVPRLTATVLPALSLRYDIALPRHFSVPGAGGIASDFDNMPAENRVTDAGATLGRVLFYDRRLSANHAVSCGSCHHQQNGFADRDRVSRGLFGDSIPRRSMALANARFYPRGRFFWDERGSTLESGVLLPIQDSREMGMNLGALVQRLNGVAFYPPLFQAAFGTADITAERIARALAQFVRSMVSADSRFDRAHDENGHLVPARLTPLEAEGFHVFASTIGNCALCHNTAAQVAREPFNTGLDLQTTDAGAGGGRFKVPSLRNVAARAPFMHDGRFATLEEVIEHYDSGVRAHPQLASQLRDVTQLTIVPRRLNMTPSQKAALLAYLRSLTDEAFLSDARFADPFAPN